MEISGKQITQWMKKELLKEVLKLKKRKKLLKVVAFMVGEATEQVSYVKMKAKIAKDIRMVFNWLSFRKPRLLKSLCMK